MNLEQVRRKKFDDILYMGTDAFKKMPSLPPELCKTDEWFFQKTFDVYNIIEETNPVIINQNRDTGLTTSLQFIICYYSLFYPEITLLVNPGNYSEKFHQVYDVFANLLNFKYDGKFMSNKIILKYNNVQYCEITILGDNVFNIADLKGPVIFDTNKVMKNYSKYEDLLKTSIKNKKKYDKLVLNFPENDDMLKLAKEYKIETKTIKIF